MESVHVFERAGLGKAPFRFLEAEDTTEYPQGQRGGTCEFCGRPIEILCRLISSDGNRFMVGSECVHKTGDAGIVAYSKLAMNKRRREKAAKAREAKRQAYMETRKALKELLEQQRDLLQKQPHPKLSWLTLADYVGWLIDNGHAHKAMDYLD